MDIGNFRFRLLGPGRGGAGEGAVEIAIKPVLGAFALLFARRGAQDWKVAIDLRAVGVDDDAAGPLRKRQRKCRLAAGCRPRN